jgi:hypothetical protein
MYHMVKYIIIHNKHEGCYDFHCYQDEVARIRLTSITINPPKIYMFNTRDEAQDFFEEYINDVDCIDIRCKRGDDVEHIDYCTCGVIELDDKGEPILFYKKKNQIFLMEHGPQLFVPNFEVKNDIKNFNLTNRLIRKCKSLGREQRKRYIELGKYCEECNSGEPDTDDEEDKNTVIKSENEVKKATNSDDEFEDVDAAPEIKVLKAVPTEGITLEALVSKVGDDVKEGMDICLKNKWIYKNGNIITRATSESLSKELAKKNEAQNKVEEKKEETKEETKKPKTVRKKKTDGDETGEKEKKPKAPRKKKGEA